MIFDKVSLVTGGFDPIHSGHLRYFERAKDFSDYLIVGLNGDPWLKRKKGTILSMLDRESRYYPSSRYGRCCYIMG